VIIHDNNDMPRIEPFRWDGENMELALECRCGKTTSWQPGRETEGDVQFRCDECESRYAISVTRIVDGNVA
jgi:hypothetical protein